MSYGRGKISIYKRVSSLLVPELEGVSMKNLALKAIVDRVVDQFQVSFDEETKDLTPRLRWMIASRFVGWLMASVYRPEMGVLVRQWSYEPRRHLARVRLATSEDAEMHRPEGSKTARETSSLLPQDRDHNAPFDLKVQVCPAPVQSKH